MAKPKNAGDTILALVDHIQSVVNEAGGDPADKLIAMMMVVALDVHAQAVTDEEAHKLFAQVLAMKADGIRG
jgi:hypothetical protein